LEKTHRESPKAWIELAKRTPKLVNKNDGQMTAIQLVVAEIYLLHFYYGRREEGLMWEEVESLSLCQAILDYQPKKNMVHKLETPASQCYEE